MDGVRYKCGVMYPPETTGKVGEEKPADPEVQAMCDSVKAAFLGKSGVNATKFEAVKYRSQVVAGTNYFVKVLLGGDQYCHLRIYIPLPHTGEEPRLDDFQVEKTEADTITLF